MDRMLYQIAGIIELIAVAGSYMDDPGAKPGSVLIGQILAPVAVPLKYTDAQGQSGVVSGIQKVFMPDLLIKMTRPDGTIYWTPLKLLMMSGVVKVSETANGSFELKASWTLEAIYTPIVGFPLAQYPFFRDPLDPAAHFSAYLEQYFPHIGLASERRGDGVSILSLDNDGAELKVGIEGSSLSLAYCDKDATTVLALLIDAKGGFASARRAPAGTFIGDATDQTEDLSAISCRNNGALKRTYRSNGGHDIRVISNRRGPAADQAVAGLVDRKDPTAARILESALAIRATVESMT